ncbi:hypothetical protein [Gillisia limnaea]|uniref:Secreted protein n=1 Tax=Gillisia limnaea (strain DSM 15749 / LMG 21470 / R-8282) TaxID=865937 RepID=H2BRX9_GILLR|nr:hypothetical protein [Gillisia limnaea]EHQ02466.1 secreted protein [Gillisia limnaea DSM 15749]
MKKLGLTFAALGLFFATTAQAQEGSEANAQVSTEVEVAVEAQYEYEKIEASALPAAVTQAIETDFAGAVAKEVWVKEKEGKKVYKIKLDLNGEEKKVYVDAEGNWIKKEDKKKEAY